MQVEGQYMQVEVFVLVCVTVGLTGNVFLLDEPKKDSFKI